MSDHGGVQPGEELQLGDWVEFWGGTWKVDGKYRTRTGDGFSYTYRRMIFKDTEEEDDRWLLKGDRRESTSTSKPED